MNPNSNNSWATYTWTSTSTTYVSTNATDNRAICRWCGTLVRRGFIARHIDLHVAHIEGIAPDLKLPAPWFESLNFSAGA